MELQICGNAGARFLPLFRRFEQKFSYPAGSQALNQIEEWTVLESPLAAAVLFAAGQVMPDIGRPQQFRWWSKLRQQNGLSFLQPHRALNNLNHIYS